MFDKVLIANRGAIACRIARTLHRMGIAPIAIYTQADADSLHVRAAAEAVLIGDGPAATSYLDPARILEAARATGAAAIHPGYGFLSESAAFAGVCGEAGIAFIGPAAEHLSAFGLKHTARAIAQASGVPLLPGSDLLAGAADAVEAARGLGYPVMLKSTAGGGGIGMRRCDDEVTLTEAFESVRRLAANNFGDVGVYLERYVEGARHVEVQVFGDGKGAVIDLGDRDCSLQRRNQKVIEEAPAPDIPAAVREAMRAAAVALARSVAYRSAGTVEFIYDRQRAAYYFLEVNTRLQVEHGVTEEVYGVDLVEWMVRLAAGELPPLDDLAAALRPRGHAVQARVYAEDPNQAFRPSAGLLTQADFPSGHRLRADTWVEAGTEISSYYDPMLAKIIAVGADRREAIEHLGAALSRTSLAGVETNLEYLRAVLATPAVALCEHDTRFLQHFAYHPATIDVLDGGTLTMVQDYPGRLGYWNVGVPPSGPMDGLSFRLGNRALGNPQDAAGLEITVAGPTLRFNAERVVMLTGAAMAATLDDASVAFWKPLVVKAGSVLAVGGLGDAGARAYLVVAGGLSVPTYLGSRATFTLAGFGGHGGRALRAGDVLHLDQPCASVPRAVPPALVPRFDRHWELRAIYGPHGAPDYFTERDIHAIFATAWEVHYHSDRTGVRLIGPRPEWARPDGGEAGLHPSNIHDNAYAIGTVDFTGDMPVILGPDGPSLGGFVCPATVVQADRWKLGQLRAGDTVRLVPVTIADGVALRRAQERSIARLSVEPTHIVAMRPRETVRRRARAGSGGTEVVYRPAGDDYLLIEFGAPRLDIALRARVHAWMEWLNAQRYPGVLDLTPGVRSLQIHYDSFTLPLAHLMSVLERGEEVLAGLDDLQVPCRVVYLPLAWDDSATRLAIHRYMQSVRRDAPWCPDNIEFIRRVNGLDSAEEVRRIVFDASYLVLGLGDVYLGAPVATPLDPRHRLVTTKYNPARTWTPENAVGIGGAYLCIYGMEGPGGYQFVGRTVQMWNRFRRTHEFEDGKPWLLRFFDQIRFFPVSEDELRAIRIDFPLGRYPLRIEPGTFNLREYQGFLDQHADSISAFRDRQGRAFREERERWREQGIDVVRGTDAAPRVAPEQEVLPPGAIAVGSPVAGSVWQVAVEAGEHVQAGQPLVVVESMKMEIALRAPTTGVVLAVRCAVGAQVTPGRAVVVLRAS